MPRAAASHKLVIAMHSSSPASIWHWPEAATAALRREFPHVEFVEYPRAIDQPASAAELAADAALFRDADAAIAWRLSPSLWQGSSIRWIHAPSAAVDPLLTPELIASSIVVTNGASIHAATVAEHAVAMMLALARGLPQAGHDQAAGRWHPHPWLEQLTTVAGTRVVLCGLGHIGRELAPRLAALGATVIGVRQHPDAVPGCAEIHAVAALPSLLPRADWLVLALPATAGTRALIGAAEMALLPQSARIVNVGRGAALDEVALAAALTNGRLAGAGLDVFAAEPLPAASPLWREPRCLITPHTAAYVADTWERQAALVARHLRRFAAGEALVPVVDKARGY